MKGETMGDSGNKYHREVVPLPGYDRPHVDVYRVLYAFDVAAPGIQHAVKKLLCAGIRGKGDYIQDLTEAKDAIRAELNYQCQMKHREWVDSEADDL